MTSFIKKKSVGQLTNTLKDVFKLFERHRKRKTKLYACQVPENRNGWLTVTVSKISKAFLLFKYIPLMHSIVDNNISKESKDPQMQCK